MHSETVRRFTEAEGFSLTAEFVEAESGKGADALDRRPQLAAALSAARRAKCPVIAAKLDRLSRDFAFISGLMAQHVPFIVAEPNLGCGRVPALPAGRHRHRFRLRSRAQQGFPGGA